MSAATVTLMACTGGPEIYACWHEAAYLSLLAELGYVSFWENFEGDVWGVARVIPPFITDFKSRD